MNIIVSKIPIITTNQTIYNSCTTDGKKFYFVNEELKEIHVFDNKYCYESKIDTNEEYINITYDYKTPRYYCTNLNNGIITLDGNFEREKEIELNILKMYKEKIGSINYGIEEDTLYIVNKNDIIYVEIEKMELGLLTGNINKEEREITAFTAIYSGKDEMYIAYNKGVEGYIAKYNKEVGIIEEYYIDDCVIKNIIRSDNKIKLFTVSNINYIYEIDFSGENVLVEDNQSEDRSCCNNKCCYNNNNNNNNNNCGCNFCKCGSCCNCNEYICNKICLNRSLSNVIESIALEEAGISHILNAEGEKLQKIIACSNNVCEILKTNECISKTVTNITMLEQILLTKLEIVSDIVCKTKCCNKKSNC